MHKEGYGYWLLFYIEITKSHLGISLLFHNIFYQLHRLFSSPVPLISTLFLARLHFYDKFMHII
jgi:hypothetical protein